RSLRTRTGLLLGTAGPDRVRDRDHFREHPERRVDLFHRRPRDLRRVHAVRLPAAETDAGYSRRTGARGIDLPRRPQRVPALAQSVQPRLEALVTTGETATQGPGLVVAGDAQ